MKMRVKLYLLFEFSVSTETAMVFFSSISGLTQNAIVRLYYKVGSMYK